MSISGAAPIRLPLTDRDVAALDLEIGAHDQEPVGVLRQRAEQLHALPFGKAAGAECDEPPTKSHLPSRSAS